MKTRMFCRHARRALRPSDLVLGLAVAALLVWTGGRVDAELGKDRVPLETLVPEDTLLFLSFPDIGKTREDWKNTGLYKIWNDPEVEHAVDTLLGNVEQYKEKFEQQFEEELGLTFDDALQVLDGQFSLAVVSMPEEQGGGPPVPRAAMALDFGEHREEMERILDWALKTLMEENPGLERGEWESGDWKITAVGDEELRLHFVMAGPTLLAATDKEIMEGMLARARDGSLASLASKDAFVRVKEETAPEGNASFLLYADVPGWIQSFRAMMGENEKDAAESDRILDAVGIEGLEAFGMAVSLTEEGVRDRIYLHAPGPRKGVLKMLTPKVTSMPALPMVPEDAVSFMAMNIDLARTWDRAFEMIKQVDEEMWADLTAEIEKFEKDAGVMIRTDLLGSMGGEVSSWSVFPEGGGVFPHSVTSVVMKDPIAFEATLQRLYDAAGMERRDLTWKDRSIRYFVAKLPEAEEGMPGRPGGPPGPRRRGGMDMLGNFGPGEMIMMNLTSFSAYFIEGGTLYTSNLVQTLKTFIDERGKPVKTPLKDASEFKKLMEKMPGDPGIVLYYDLDSTFRLVYNSLLPIAQMAEVFLRRGLGVPFETAALPTADAVSRHLSPSLTAVANRPGGVLVSSYSTTGVTTGALLGVVGVGVTAAVAIPGLMRSRSGANETSAIASLKAISTGQEMFKNAVAVDQNVNGVGEYGFLQELAGTSPCRTPGGLEGPTYAASPFIPQLFGLIDAEGRSVKSGYYFKVFLPGKQDAVSATMQVPPGDEAVAPLQETAWCAYAWPALQGKTGVQTFFVNQNGQVYASRGAYSGDHGPAPSAAFNPEGENPDNLMGMVGGQGSDGNFWMPAD